jgi:hypothetical protein
LGSRIFFSEEVGSALDTLENEQPSEDFHVGGGAALPEKGMMLEPLAAASAERVQGRNLEGAVGLTTKRKRPPVERIDSLT